MKILLQIAALTLVITANAQGTFEAVLGYTNPIAGIFQGTVGWTFQTTENITVTDLGVFANVVSSQTNIQVGLWNASNILLASNTVTAGSPLTNQTRYVSITPVLCVPGVIYHLGAFYPNASSISVGFVDPALGGTVALSSEIQLRGSAQNTNSFLASPTELNGADGSIYLAPNFKYNLVPEPSGLAFLCLGGLILATARKKSACRRW